MQPLAQLTSVVNLREPMASSTGITPLPAAERSSVQKQPNGGAKCRAKGIKLRRAVAAKEFGQRGTEDECGASANRQFRSQPLVHGVRYVPATLGLRTCPSFTRRLHHPANTSDFDPHRRTVSGPTLNSSITAREKLRTIALCTAKIIGFGAAGTFATRVYRQASGERTMHQVRANLTPPPGKASADRGACKFCDCAKRPQKRAWRP
jgi:hypothetical protein